MGNSIGNSTVYFLPGNPTQDQLDTFCRNPLTNRDGGMTTKVATNVERDQTKYDKSIFDSILGREGTPVKGTEFTCEDDSAIELVPGQNN